MLAGLDTHICEQLSQLLSEKYRVHICNYGPEVLLEYSALLPELLVIDLNMGGCDTVGLLRAVQARNGGTQVLATACSYLGPIRALLSMLDTAFLLIPPLDAGIIATRLLQLERFLPESNIDAEELLLGLGLDRHSAGFPCLCKAISYKCDHPQCLYINDLCIHIADSCGGTAPSVDKSMTRCIRKAWRRRDPALWSYYLGSAPAEITCAQFIGALATYISRHRGVEKCI